MKTSKVRLLAVCVVLLTTLTGCGMRYSMAMSWHPVRKFHRDPVQRYEITPIEHVETQLTGVNIWGFPAKRIDLENIGEEFLTNDRRFITNSQIIAGSYITLFFDYFFTISYAKVAFDVVEVGGESR